MTPDKPVLGFLRQPNLRFYGGSDLGCIRVEADALPAHDLPASVLIDLPPLGGLVLRASIA